MTPLNIIYRNPDDLKPRTQNPRTHSNKQICQIAESIKQFGFTNPVLIDRQGGIIAGHGRVEAAKQINLDKVPTVRLEDLSEEQIRALVIADNRLAENAGWDLTIVDEAHHVELGAEQDADPAYLALSRLAAASKGLLLLTATPEQLGHKNHFALLRLLDPARFNDYETFVLSLIHI